MKPSRQAANAIPAWLIAKTLVQIAAFWGLFLFIIPPLLAHCERQIGLGGIQFDSTSWQRTGLGIFTAASALGLWSAGALIFLGQGTPLPLDGTRHLVIRGPYAVVRNPMAIAGLAQGVGVGLYLGSPSVIAYALLGGVVWHLLVRPWEEADLERRFGADYQRYRMKVRCWLPKRPRPQAPNEGAGV